MTQVATAVMEPDDEGYVRIPVKEYNSLRFVSAQMDAMDAAGVDNWIGYDEVDWPKEEDFDL